MIRIGPAGWAYKDWEGIVYPKPKPRGFDPVAYLARHIDAIEINSSFYGSPAGTGPGLGRARWRQSALSASPPSCARHSRTTAKPPSRMRPISRMASHP